MPLTYHYCSLETACAIISNASLRLCDITKSNDSAEITYGYAAALDSLKRIGLISGSGPTLEFADHWIELLRPEYQTLLREALSRHLLPPNRLCYAVCLSERADQLSQWRAYGDDGRGSGARIRPVDLRATGAIVHGVQRRRAPVGDAHDDAVPADRLRA